jgi:hypothetical protein
MRRAVAALSLAVVIVGAAWCVDGCADPFENASTSSGPVELACTICVVPFAVTQEFDLPPDTIPVSFETIALTPGLVSAPPLTIDHPPRVV